MATTRGTRVFGWILVLSLAWIVLLLCSCQASADYRTRMEDAGLSWEREKAALIKEMDESTISKDQYIDERQALDKAYREELKAATEQFKEDAKREAKMVADGAVNPWQLGATLVASLIAGFGAIGVSKKQVDAAKKYSDDTAEWYDRERDRRRAARGERFETLEPVEKKPA